MSNVVALNIKTKPRARRGKVAAKASDDRMMIGDDDPIFAAIRAHRAAWSNYSAAIDLETAIEAKVVRDERTYDKAYQDACRATVDASEAADSVAMSFLDIEPTTIAGVAALLSYVGTAPIQMFPEFDDDDRRRLFETEIMHHVAEVLFAQVAKS